MKQKEFLQEIHPYIGGGENISRVKLYGNELNVTVKDSGVVDLVAMGQVKGVDDVELNRSRLVITIQNGYLEELIMTQEEKTRLATNILEAVGGKENVTNILHCATRLRFNLNDYDIPKPDEMRKIKGVLGCQVQSGQFQVIIGPEVATVYDELCSIGGFVANKVVEETIDSDTAKEKLTLKKVGANILDALAGCLGPLIPLIIASSMFKMVVSVFGPSGLALFAEESNTYILLNMVGDAGFYFLPVAITYTASKKFNTNTMTALLLGFILIHPTLVGMVGTPFTVYGIPSSVQNYSNTLLPAILSVWVMSYVERFVKKVIPKSLHLVFAAAVTIAIMLPITLCVLGPMGNFFGNYVSIILVNLQKYLGPIGVAVIAGLYGFLVLSGMHLILVTQVMVTLATTPDPYLVGALWCWVVSVLAVSSAIAVKAKNKDTKTLAVTCLISGITAGVSEPALFGLCIRYKRPLFTLTAGAAIGGLVSGILGVTCNSVVCMFSNFVGIVGWVTTSNSVSNIIHIGIALVVSFAATFILTYMFGYTKEMDEE